MVFDREPIIRRIERRIDDRAHRFRINTFDKPLQRRVPKIGQRNLGQGIGAGVVEAGIAIVLEETVGIPFGSDVEVVDTEGVEGGTLYTVNVDAPLENMARARGFFEATTGFTSLLTDVWMVENVEVLRTRPLRDTYQIEVMVRD